MKIAVIQISEAGQEIASTLKQELGAKTIGRAEVGRLWKKFDAFVFIVRATLLNSLFLGF